MDLDGFVASVANIPHISEAIVSHLGALDVASCLRTNKSLRSFVCQGCHRPDVRTRLDRDARRQVCMAGKWRSGNVGLKLASGVKNMNNFSCVGVDSWVCRSGRADKVVVYNMRTREDVGIMETDTQDGPPRLRVLNGKTILLEGAENLVLTLPASGRYDDEEWFLEPTYSSMRHLVPFMNNRDLGELCDNSPGVAFGFTFLQPRWMGRGAEGIFFFDKRGRPDYKNVCNLDMDKAPIKIAKQEGFTLMGWKNLLKLYDVTTGAEMWRTQVDKDVNGKLPMFVTGTICGYVYRVEKSADVAEYRLAIFDSRNGTLVDDLSCFVAGTEYEKLLRNGNSQPSVIAKGDYFCALTSAAYERAAGEGEKFQLKGLAFKCVRAERSQDGKIRLKSNGFCIDYSSRPSFLPDKPINPPPRRLIGQGDNKAVDPRFLGFVFDGVAVLAHENRKSVADGDGSAATIFTIDVQKAVEKNSQLHEVFRHSFQSAIPREGNVSFWPHYKSSPSGNDLMGLLEIKQNTDGERTMTSHLFQQEIAVKMGALSVAKPNKRKVVDQDDVPAEVKEKRKREV